MFFFFRWFWRMMPFSAGTRWATSMLKDGSRSFKSLVPHFKGWFKILKSPFPSFWSPLPSFLWSSLPSSGTRGLPGNWRPLSFSDRGRKLQLEVRFDFNLKTSYRDHLDLMDLTLPLTWKFRFIFPFDYLAAEEKIVISKKESLFRWTNIFQKTNQEMTTYIFL